MDKNYFGITDTGKVRSNNEDTFIAERIAETDFVMACVIDGVGGYSGGEVAAAIARETLLRLLNKPEGDLSLLMQAALAEANDQIIIGRQQNKEHEDMACVLTLALVDIKNNRFYYAHVGDTRLYLLRDGSLIKISKDQSFVGFMEDSGRLTEEQAMQHPKRNEINKALGFAGNIGLHEDYMEMGHSPFLPGDLILLCSDGLSDMVNKQELTAILLKETDLELQGIELINAANRNGGLDNITAVLVKNTNVSFAHEAAKPVSRPSKKKTPLVSPAASIPVVASDIEKADQPPVVAPVAGQKGKGINPWLLFVALIILLSAVYLYWKWFSGEPANVPANIPDSTLTIQKTQEEQLQDTLNKLRGNILILDDSLFKSPVLISKPIQITRDSLYLKAESNIVFKSDSGYTGQPFFIAPANKSSLFENFTFENFKEVNALQKKGVLLKDVKFLKTDSLTPAARP
ncbi:serine/threonine protein phosphatase PrpC [Pedobacter africanus]|uniref:Serine/threonine protein phosphatase PrpC n=1 Tax=Pedobacter africanus TaxID=151894 RepID=A0ACC6KSH7_9SPHI|nr:protein phosphatase 2C domain-containing protein [Pedobacter africanus]MDR6782092.1 serine/threonine protein phosphatase PrpC [Pedobacter africanus]